MKNKLKYRLIEQSDVNIHFTVKELLLLTEKEIQELPLEYIAVLKQNRIKALGYHFLSQLTPQQLGTILVTRLAVLNIDELQKLYKQHKNHKIKTQEIKKIEVNGKYEFFTIETGLLPSKIKKAIEKRKEKNKSTQEYIELNKVKYSREEISQYFRYYSKNYQFYSYIKDILDEEDCTTNEKLLQKVNELYPGDPFTQLPRIYSLNDLERLYNVAQKTIYERIQFLNLPCIRLDTAKGLKPLVTEKEKNFLFEIRKIQ